MALKLFLATLLSVELFCGASSTLSVHSLGSITASGAHKDLKAEQYMADLSAYRGTERAGVQTERADVGHHKVFGLTDVQSAVERVFLENGASFPSHSHPRGAETLYVESGAILSSLRFEGFLAQRVVRITLTRGRVTVFPQGLPHFIECASEAGCTYISFWNTADPGLVAAPAFL